MEQLLSAWQSIEPLITHLSPLEISNLAFVNKEILTFIQLYFKRIKEKGQQQLVFHFFKEYSDPQIYSVCSEFKIKNIHPAKNWKPISLNSLKGKMMKIHKNSTDKCRFISNVSKNYHNETDLIIQITKIIIDGGVFKIYGWILSGKNIMYMKMKEGKKFNPYPFWSIITSQNTHNYTFLPHSYKKIEPSYQMVYHGI